MVISVIAAMDLDRAIGRENRMPWHLPKDLARFRSLTMGHPVIMGRKTFESIGHPLPGRTNIVISRQVDYSAEGCVVVRDLDAAFAACGSEDEVFVLGGAEVFRSALQRADRIYLTLVHTRIDGDTFFPDVPEDFTETSRLSATDIYELEFLNYERLPL